MNVEELRANPQLLLMRMRSNEGHLAALGWERAWLVLRVAEIDRQMSRLVAEQEELVKP